MTRVHRDSSWAGTSHRELAERNNRNAPARGDMKLAPVLAADDDRAPSSERGAARAQVHDDVVDGPLGDRDELRVARAVDPEQ